MKGNKSSNINGGRSQGRVDIQTSIPSFQTHSLMTAFGNLHEIQLPYKCVPTFIRMATPSPSRLWPISYFLVGLEPAQYRGCQYLGAHWTPPPTVATPLGTEKLIPSICDLSFLIILFVFFLYYCCIHYTFAHIEHFSPFLADNNQYFAAYVSLKPGMKYLVIITHDTYYPRCLDPWVGRRIWIYIVVGTEA